MYVNTQVHVFKPASSKAGNSEQYLICLGYKGRSNVLTHGHLEKFRAVYGTRTPSCPFLPLGAIPDSFLRQIISCATRFSKNQVCCSLSSSYQKVRPVGGRGFMTSSISFLPTSKLNYLRNLLRDHYAEGRYIHCL